MGYAVYNLRGNYGRKDSDAKKFEEAAMMVEEGLECMRELADEMEDKYSERRYAMRGGYGMRGTRTGTKWTICTVCAVAVTPEAAICRTMGGETLPFI